MKRRYEDVGRYVRSILPSRADRRAVAERVGVSIQHFDRVARGDMALGDDKAEAVAAVVREMGIDPTATADDFTSGRAELPPEDERLLAEAMPGIRRAFAQARARMRAEAPSEAA
jgi:DNA-binding LacI/PurR family transcriptional regulator